MLCKCHIIKIKLKLLLCELLETLAYLTNRITQFWSCLDLGPHLCSFLIVNHNSNLKSLTFQIISVLMGNVKLRSTLYILFSDPHYSILSHDNGIEITK
jgi:hypothetical protein